jgi:hypothetical protein
MELDSAVHGKDNGVMEIPGRIHNGVVVLEGSSELPEGAAVTVTYPPLRPVVNSCEKRRVQFPLVRSANPGSVNLTNERIAELLNDEDVPA